MKGYALPHGDTGPVTRVEVSTDDGKTWEETKVLREDEGHSKWAWALWNAAVKLGKGKDERILFRAMSSGGNLRPDEPKWNPRRGYVG